MAITTEVYLRCDSARCSEKVTWEAPVDGEHVSDEIMEMQLRSVAKSEGWLELHSQLWEGLSRLFHSEKCVRDFLVDKRKMEKSSNESLSDAY